jgi:hypothetical protein
VTSVAEKRLFANLSKMMFSIKIRAFSFAFSARQRKACFSVFPEDYHGTMKGLKRCDDLLWRMSFRQRNSSPSIRVNSMTTPELWTLVTTPGSFIWGLRVVHGIVISTSTAVPGVIFSWVSMKIPWRVRFKVSAENDRLADVTKTFELSGIRGNRLCFTEMSSVPRNGREETYTVELPDKLYINLSLVYHLLAGIQPPWFDTHAATVHT